MADELVSLLAVACVALTAGLMLLLALRWPLRQLFGATLAYQCWLLVPVLVSTVMLPRPNAVHKPAVVTLVQASAGSVVTAVRPADDWTVVLVFAWLGGVLALAGVFWRAHASFVRGLGTLAPAGGVHVSSSRSAGPALIGLLRPKIVVPADFEARYTEQERALVVEHERIHARRGDLAVNLVQAAIQCIFWFNPLVHFAARWFRADQEMACDAAVLRRHPGLVRTYAQALLKSQDFSTAVPLTVACSWRIHHPVKERFMILQQQQAGQARRFAGRFLVASIVLATGYAGLAARASEVAPGATVYDIALTLNVNGKESRPRVLARSGEQFAVEVTDAIRAQFVISPVNVEEKTFKLAGTVTDGAGKTMRPVLIGRLGQHLGISAGIRDAKTESGGFDIRMLVQEARPREAQPSR